MSNSIKKEKKTIPTYIPKKAMDLPIFFEKKPYQGASGRLYPLPFSDSISDTKTDVEYDIYTLENEYIMTQVLPDKGGKILRGYDKVGNYDFIYHNEVIKPALVGLAGPWISGGIEFNYPQHHRPTTYMPFEAMAEESENGEKTVWTGEVEPFNRMKGMVGISIDEGRSYIKAKVKVYNRTNQPQVFMWWANLAVPVNDTYKTIFPPDVKWVNDHDRRCVMSWPIAKGIYHTARPFDYGEGTDISMYDAIKVPSSFLVSQGQSDMDFVAGYDGGKQKGIVTVADHHISPGKKMWHWGKGDFGEMWCSNLTDKNGPYIELMTGVYTDNQPDFTWIAPYESRVFEQYWYPIREIGDVKNATIDAAVNVEQRGEKLFFGFNVTGSFKNAKINVYNKDSIIFTDTADLDPTKAYLKESDMHDTNIGDIKVELLSDAGKILVDYKTYKRGQKQPIKPRKPVVRPSELETVEELYINGLHLEQYKQHNYDARDYYLEGIRRAPSDIRCNTGMARISYKNGQFADCIKYADTAISKITQRNMHPSDTEAMYFKGLALKTVGKEKEAYDILSMAAWDYRFRSAAYFELALLDCKNGAFADALEKLDTSTSYNSAHPKAFRNLALSYFDKKGDYLSAKACMETALENKPDDPRLILEYQQILRNMNYSPEYMLDVYDKYEALMLQRDDCYLDKITLKCMTGEYKEAIGMAKYRRFHIYEGGEGKLTKQHAWMHVLYGNVLCREGNFDDAEKVYKDGINMPKSYGEAKTFFNQEAHIYYYLGRLLETCGKDASEAYKAAAVYKAAVSEISLFRALALRKLQNFSGAKAVLDEMEKVANNFIENCDMRTYYGVGSPSPMPFELDIKKTTSPTGIS